MIMVVAVDEQIAKFIIQTNLFFNISVLRWLSSSINVENSLPEKCKKRLSKKIILNTGEVYF